MMWLSWRQFRTQAAAVYAGVVAFAAVLAVTGPRLVDLARAHPAAVLDGLSRSDRLIYNAGLVVVAVAPAVVGAFWGAPLVARELESGTYRLAWTQSVTRTRWLATKIGVAALAAAAAVGALTLAVTWWAGPLDGGTGSGPGGMLPARLTPVAFAMRGIVPAAYAVFALVLGVAVGLVLRRTLPAMAVTLALFTLVQVAVPLWVRPHLVPPVRQTVAIQDRGLEIQLVGPGTATRLMTSTGDRRDWVLRNVTVDPSGRPVSLLPSWFSDCLPRPDEAIAPKSTLEACIARLDGLGYRQLLVYQPASRFWPLQWAETGVFLGLSALLTWFCFWWTRRRLT